MQQQAESRCDFAKTKLLKHCTHWLNWKGNLTLQDDGKVVSKVFF